MHKVAQTNHMSNQKNLNIIAKELFFMAKQLGQVMSDIAFTPYGQLRIRKIPARTYYYNLKKFERNGLIKKVKKPEGAMYILTERAKLLRSKPNRKVSRTDGLATIIMFDIPEENRNARDVFRRYLVKNGYTQIQKSVFISPFSIFDELKEMIDQLGIKSNVTLISGTIDR